MENFIKDWFTTVNISRNILFNAPQFARDIEAHILEHECFRKYQTKNNQKLVSVYLNFIVYINFSCLHPLEYADI